jgi:rhodanese-related sulfurtransferase
MADIMERTEEIRRDVPVVIHCKSGQRAAAMVYALRNDKGFENVYLLEGGIEAWAREIDPTIIVY